MDCYICSRVPAIYWEGAPDMYFPCDRGRVWKNVQDHKVLPWHIGPTSARWGNWDMHGGLPPAIVQVYTVRTQIIEPHAKTSEIPSLG